LLSDGRSARTTLSLHVLFQPQAKTNRTDQQITDYYNQVIDLARQAPGIPGGTVSSPDGSIVVQAYADPRMQISLAPSQDTTGSWIIEDQVRGGLEDALDKKLKGQLKRAKAAGHPVAVLLDQIPRPGRSEHSVDGIASGHRLGRPAHLEQESGCNRPGLAPAGQVWLRPAATPPVYVAPAVHLLIAEPPRPLAERRGCLPWRRRP
jgi:hypothetical protein